MRLLIDGYNLLHVTGIVGRGIGPGTLERSRRALLNFIATSLEASQRRETTVVFDAKQAPPGLPRTQQHHGLTVMYASQFEDADALIEELIRTDSAPRRLVVVSSDHRLQRAARRRRATAVDSDQWYANLIQKRRDHAAQKNAAPEKPSAPLAKAEVQWWLAQFADIDLNTLLEDSDPSARGRNQSSDKIDSSDVDQSWKPFPPGYGQDILDGEES